MEDSWADIRCNYYNEFDGFWRVDAWKGFDDPEEGTVIAYIDSLTSRVIYVNPKAYYDSYAQTVINKKIHELENNRIRVRFESGNLNVYFNTDCGTLVAQIEKKEDVGSDNIYVGVHLSEHDDEYLDLTGIKVISNTKDVYELGGRKYVLTPMIFGNPASEDYTAAGCITDREINEVFRALSDERLRDWLLPAEDKS